MLGRGRARRPAFRSWTGTEATACCLLDRVLDRPPEIMMAAEP
jgi:hypothetical protein